MNSIDLAILLVTSCTGVATLWLTSGRAGGYLVYPRAAKGLPGGRGATADDGTDNGGTGENNNGGGGGGGDNGGGNNDNDNGGNDNGGDNGGGNNDNDNGGNDNGGDNGGGNNDLPVCKFGLISKVLLAEKVEEVLPYVIARQPVPWIRVRQSPYQLDKEFLQNGYPVGYYITATVLETALGQNLSTDDWVGGPFPNPGCVLEDSAFEPGTPLGRIVETYYLSAEQENG